MAKVMILRIPEPGKEPCMEEMRDYVLECAFNPYNMAALGEDEQNG